MAIPDYQSLMLPVLRQASDGSEISIRQCIQSLAEQYGLSESEKAQMLPSGKQSVFDNRVHWAKSYLTQAGLLEATRRGHFHITDRGTELLKANLQRIDNDLLAQYPEFIAFRDGVRDTSAQSTAKRSTLLQGQQESTTTVTPEERIESAHAEITDELRRTVLQRILANSPGFFEKLILDLLTAMGYGGSRAGAARRVGRSGDGGIDGIIDEDPLGLDIVYLQAKRYAPGTPVTEEKIREFSGTLLRRGASKGVFVTTSEFTRPARQFVEGLPQQRIILIDGDLLTRLIIQYSVGVRTDRVFEIKKIDIDYFDGDDMA